MKLQLLSGAITLICLLSVNAQAGRLKSYCVLPENSSTIEGVNIDERLPIASVSKVFTSLFAITQNSINRKINTQFYYTNVGGGLYDVHIQGAHEPYFGKESMQWLISKLNEAGVTRIRNLTFDENFKYLHETDKRFNIGRKQINPVSGKDGLEGPTPETIKAQLSQRSVVISNYAKTLATAKGDGVNLVKQLSYNPQNIAFRSSSEFRQEGNTKKGYISSPDVLHMLKLMNWNSNNHASNQMMEFSGGIQKFNEFFYNKMKFNENQLKFVNGSGQNASLDGRLYNEASCATVVRVVKGLKKNLELQKATLQDALAVVGGDVSSTVSGRAYNNPTTNLSVIAKSGTVGTNVTLAGMISSKKGNHFFFFNVETGSVGKRNTKRARDAEENRCRSLISAKLTQLVAKLGGGQKIDYKIQTFDPERFEDAEEAQADDDGLAGDPIARFAKK